VLELCVTPSEEGQKVLKYLLRKSDGTKVFLYKLFRRKKILVNKIQVKPDYILKSGDIVSSENLKEHSLKDKFKGISKRISILYMDKDIIAVDKDADISVHPDGKTGFENVLLEQLKAFLFSKGEDYSFLAPVHRIDKDTRGVTLFARNFETARMLGEDFKSGNIIRIYLCLLEGILKKPIFVEADIIHSEKSRRVKVINKKINENIPDRDEWINKTFTLSKTISGTCFYPEKIINGKTLCKIEIFSGRHHQIRAISSAIGFPLSGDRIYGNQTQNKKQALVCKRMIIKRKNLIIESRFNIELKG